MFTLSSLLCWHCHCVHIVVILVIVYRVDSSLVRTEQTVTVSYSGGEWSGTLARELVSIGGSPSVDAKFALIQSSSTFFIPGAEWVGILGLAYDSLAKVRCHARSCVHACGAWS